MGVTEIIDQIGKLKPEELRQVKAAVANAEAAASEAEEPEPDEATLRRRDAAWEKLRKGLGTAGGKHLSANIDDALYGGEG